VIVWVEMSVGAVGYAPATGCDQQARGSKGCFCSSSSSSSCHCSETCKKELPKLFQAMDRMEKSWRALRATSRRQILKPNQPLFLYVYDG
jgi:hypothetical protein